MRHLFFKKSRLEKLFGMTSQNVCKETSKAIMTMVKSHLARTISKSLVMIVVLDSQSYVDEAY